LKSSNYIPEIICLVLFTCFSCLWVLSLKEEKTNNVQLSPLLALERLIPQHKVQLLNANFSDFAADENNREHSLKNVLFHILTQQCRQSIAN